MSLLIHGATVVTSLDPVSVGRLDVAIADGRVMDVAPALAADGALLDASGCLVVPGNINAHTHAYSALARGMPYELEPPRNFLEILQRVWWRLDRALDDASIRASALVAAKEALLSGTTTLIDHHASPNAIGGSLDVLASVFGEIGLRSVLCYEVTDRDGAERAADGIEENRRFARDAARGAWPLARALIGAHAAFTLSDETLADLAELARDEKIGVHVHLAEDAIDAGGARRLDEAGLLNDEAIAAHAVRVGRDDAARLTEARATVVHNPRSNMNNGVGRAPLAWLTGPLALGTDGIGADMWEEGRAGYFRHREESLDAGADWPLRRLAVGARRAGRSFGEPSLGRIERSAPADLVVLDYRPPTRLDSSSLAGHWVFGLGGPAVRDVVVGGEIVVRDRHLTRVDEAEVAAFAANEADALWARISEIGPHAFAPPGLMAGAGAACG